MDDITLKIIAGVVCGSIGGSVLTYTVGRFEIYRKARRIRSALLAEFSSANRKVKEKLGWLSRDVSKDLRGPEERIVDCDEKKLYLGENEAFGIKCRYWEDKYCEIVEILGEVDFLQFAKLHDQLASFVEKFSQMKMAFDAKSGDQKEMARACYRDLVTIEREIERQIDNIKTCLLPRISTGSVSHSQTVAPGACTPATPSTAQ